MNTPFIDFKAAEISPEKQKRFFVEPKHINRLISPKASIIIGERGSGKTTILKHLEKIFNYSDDLEYIGIYHRFETAYVKALYNPEMTEYSNISAFSQAIVAILSKMLCKTIDEIKEYKKISLDLENEICRKLVTDIELIDVRNVNTFKQLADIFESIRKKTVINLQNGKMKCYIDYTSFFMNFCEELKKEKLFEKACFCVLFDEYENLTFTQQRVINSFIKSSSYYLSYKVCMRPDGFLTKDTIADKEPLMIGHDYEEINYIEDIIGAEKDVKNHLRKVCANRLQYFYDQEEIGYSDYDLDIDRYLDYIKDEEDIETWERIIEYEKFLQEDLVKKYPSEEKIIRELKSIDLKLIYLLKEKEYSEKDIFENINGNSSKYKNWLHNYKKNIIFQIISECEQTKKYCGFDTIIKLANSNTRTVLEILHYTFGELDNNNSVYPVIDVKMQTKAINRVSKSMFDQIDYIPFHGYKAKNLANALGNLFENYLVDKRAKKFEVNSFSIKSDNMDEEKVKELKDILRDSVIWGVLIPYKANKMKNHGDIVYDGRDYMLHPIFAPYFKISYRKRQKCELNDVDVYSMLSLKSSKELREIIRRISNNSDEEYFQEEFRWV